MDLNVALNELGMLSSVTESRRDFLKEKQAQKQHKDCFQVVQLNTQYVTCMGPVLRSRRPRRNGQSSDSTNDNEEAVVSLRASKPEHDMYVGEGRVARHRRTRVKYAKPYQVPGRARRQRRITDPSDGNKKRSVSASSEDAAMANGIDNLPLGASARSLSRSKSMDELESKVKTNGIHSNSDHGNTGEKEMPDNVEAVAKHMKDLKVK